MTWQLVSTWKVNFSIVSLGAQARNTGRDILLSLVVFCYQDKTLSVLIVCRILHMKPASLPRLTVASLLWEITYHVEICLSTC